MFQMTAKYTLKIFLGLSKYNKNWIFGMQVIHLATPV
jgi:hypothetical protein